MTALDIAVKQLKIDEGFRSKAYPDPLSGGDPWTIGYGCTGPGIQRGVVWTQEKAEAELLRRVQAFAAKLDQSLPWWRSLDPARGAVLLNMAYNMGVKGLLGFKNTLADIRVGRYSAAADKMLASKWAKQVGARALRLADQMRHAPAP